MGRMSKHNIDAPEYETRRIEFSARGMDLPQSKLTPLEVESIRSAAKQRDALRASLRTLVELSRKILYREHGVRPLRNLVIGEVSLRLCKHREPTGRKEGVIHSLHVIAIDESEV